MVQLNAESGVIGMDYEEMESELEMAGIDPFEFSLMDEDERREVLEDNYLDPWDFEDFDLEYPGGYSCTPPVTPVTPKPPVTPSASFTSRPSPVISPSVPVKPEPSPIITRPAVDLNIKNETVSSAPHQQRQAEIAKIDRKMLQLRYIMITLASLLVIVVVAGISTASRSPRLPVPAYTINPTTEIVRLPSPTPRPTPRTTSTPMPTVPYVGMYVFYVPSKWTWQGTDNLTVKDTAGNKVRTIKYHYDDLPKQYTIWVSEATNRVVKVSITDPTPSAKRSSSTKKKSSSDPYGAKDYAHPDDFYYDYYDDFWDYEDAEDYWEEYN